MSAASDTPSKTRRSIFVLLPLVVFAALAVLFYVGLHEGDPSLLPSALIGKPMPKTDLPPIEGLTRDGKPVPGLTDATFKDKVTLVNVWASWCIPCHDEVPFLQALAQDKRIQLVGINYKDAAADARRFLGRYGNPYAASGADRSGREFDQLGRLWRAGDLSHHARRPHRLQAGGPDRRPQSAEQARTADRESVGQQTVIVIAREGGRSSTHQQL